MDIEQNIELFKNIFSKVLKKYFHSTDIIEPEITKHNGFISLDYNTSYISISGDYYGYVLLTANDEIKRILLTNLANKMNMPLERIQKRIDVGIFTEILNQVTGNLTDYVKNEKINANITIPSILLGDDIKIYSSNTEIYSLTYYTNKLPLKFFIDMAAHQPIF
jgi:CheY-specific phosphatase CheX